MMGEHVSMSYDGLIVAAAGIADTWTNATRYVRIYEWNGSTWAQRGEDIIQVMELDWKISHSISLSSDGNIIAIGNPAENLPLNHSFLSVLVLDESSGDWAPFTSGIDSRDSVDVDGSPIMFGSAVALYGDGRTVVAAGYPVDVDLDFCGMAAPWRYIPWRNT